VIEGALELRKRLTKFGFTPEKIVEAAKDQIAAPRRRTA